MTLSTPAASLLASLSDDLATAVAHVGRSIVAVHSRRRLPASGIVWQPDLVVTAAHALERGLELTISHLDAEARIPARLLGYDPSSDLALLGVSSAPLPPADRASLDSVSPGHLVLGVGRPGTPTPMASFGVVTSTGGAWRTAGGAVLDAYVRADIALLPGFSGGALADVQGRVVGLLSSYLAGGDPVAIPVASVERIVQAIQSGGPRRRAFLGISTQPVELQHRLRDSLGLAQETGLMLLGLEPAGPAERAGLLLGDILLAIGERAIVDGEALQMALGPEVVGVPQRLRLVRGGQLHELVVTPAERPNP